MVTMTAAALSGLLWLGGFGLHPIPVLTWLAPVPLLLLGVPKKALTATLVAWPIGQLAMAGYYLRTLRIPLPVVIGFVIYGTALAAGTVLLAGGLLRRGRTVTAVLAVPALWVLGEYLVSVLMPNGAWWSLAYTQAGVRPVIQLTSLTGVWGVSYLLIAVPIALAALLTRPKAAVACLLVLAVSAGGWATWSLNRRPGAGERLAVGLVALEQPEDGMALDAAPDLLTRYLARAESLAARGATIVVLPEKVFGVGSRKELEDAFRPVTDRGVQVIVGAVLTEGDTRRNVAFVLGGTGRTYTKQHLIRGLEDWFTAGDQDLVVGRRGVAVCKDLDFPGLVRRYRARGATMLLVPALDFGGDGWLHSRMAVVRGVESGMTVVRAADFGRLTVSDATGRVLGEVTTGDAELLVTVTPGVVGTVYGRTGDWFVMLALVLFPVALWPVRDRFRRGGSERRRRSAGLPRRGRLFPGAMGEDPRVGQGTGRGR
ncbi:nitrilase-related carbon-nitrogen hydrolase [Actinoplanes oblitus]|uniref:Nitrilase-related carbon-nitrogen hydrolase n=1 Tax=Actinoplanes oblitus TaxID=3040509 RepID=A0ABY8W6A3_9ACTN|nr:nitrilase-related carbon-nitrogen hydrolase [Actinoplanes oblitus]WIM93340.1 nitrilase-related carbon-nitrogen hydrolase [Actinoplanes oblitus]